MALEKTLLQFLSAFYAIDATKMTIVGKTEFSKALVGYQFFLGYAYIQLYLRSQNNKLTNIEHFGNVSANESDYYGEVSNYWRLNDGYMIGFIESVSNPFCSSCTRARISANGNMYTCLFTNKGNDLKSLFDLNADKEDIRLAIKAIWEKRTDRYSEIRGKLSHNPMPVEMHFIGG